MHDDEIPTRPPTFGDHAGPPTEAPPPTTAPAPAVAPTPANADVRKWVGAGIGIVAIAVAALVGTGIVSSDASTGGQGGPGGFRGNGAPPGFTGGGQGGFPGGGTGGFRGGFPGGQVPSNGTFDPQQLVPSSPTTTTPKTSVN